MTTTVPERLTCPHCGSQFTVQVIASYTRLDSDTDFRPNFAGMDILEFQIHTCAGCGFSGVSNDFNGTVPPDAARLIDERLTPLVRDERSDASRRYEYAAWIAEWRGLGDRAVADHYLRAAWCSRDSAGAVRNHQDSYYRGKAIEHFERVLANDTAGTETAAITYLIGELYRRNGAFDEARSWFAEAVKVVGDDDEQKWVADIADAQAKLALRGVTGDHPGH